MAATSVVMILCLHNISIDAC